MGDRCYVRVTARKQDLKLFGEVTEWGDCWDTEGAEETDAFGVVEESPVELSIDEVNYGGTEELIAATAKGIPFIGSHDSGGCYGAELFCSDGKEYFYVRCDEDCYPTVRYDLETGVPEAADVRDVAVFVKAYARARAIVEGKG